MTTRRNQAKPGYLEFRPPSYQVLGPEQESALDKILATYPDSQGTTQDQATRTSRFWVRTPQVRCRVRVTIFAKPDQPSPGNPQPANPDVDRIDLMYEPDSGSANPRQGVLWVTEHERGNGPGIKASPVRNVVGTAEAPLVIPTDVRLWGYVVEVETNGTELYGVFVAPDNIEEGALAPSRWHVCVRYETVIPVSDEEWNQFLGKQCLRVEPQHGVTIESGGPP